MRALTEPVPRRGANNGDKYKFAEVATYEFGAMYEEGVDFPEGRADSVRAYASTWAKLNGLAVHTKRVPGGMMIQFVKKADES